jgi:hypothetical protein
MVSECREQYSLMYEVLCVMCEVVRKAEECLQCVDVYGLKEFVRMKEDKEQKHFLCIQQYINSQSE